jgi:hypothetical protein
MRAPRRLTGDHSPETVSNCGRRDSIHRHMYGAIVACKVPTPMPTKSFAASHTCQVFATLSRARDCCQCDRITRSSHQSENDPESVKCPLAAEQVGEPVC